MNALASASRNRWTATFGWLLRREFWENRGGFLWSHLIAGLIIVTLAVLGAIVALVKVGGAFVPETGSGDLAEFQRSLGLAGDAILATGMTVTGVVVAFVVFFYALGSLYDDRRDRSALFWKSLPISDTQTVLSKAAWALLLAPLIALVVGLLIGLALWLVAGVTLAVGGVPHASALLTHSHPFRVAGQMLAALPIGLLWSLPAVGWLMFCSAWVRSKPFLWAVLIPFLGSMMISVLGAMPGLDIPVGRVWYVAVYRGLMSVVPGTWALPGLEQRLNTNVSPDELVNSILGQALEPSLYTGTDLWIGAVVGIAFIAAATYMRRWRDEA
jgi:ABC-2 type transport system permease protein